MHTALCFSPHLPFRVIFLSQSLPPPHPSFSFQSGFFFVCLVMHLLAFSLSHTKSQSIINSYSLSHSLPLSFPHRSGLFILPYILSITLQQITHATHLRNFRLLINQSARVLASLTLKRLKSTLHFISFAYTYSTVCTFVQRHIICMHMYCCCKVFERRLYQKEGTSIKT